MSRFIPVCTGNMSFIPCTTFHSTVYPCVYREHNDCRKYAESRGGLSLCVQGTLDLNHIIVKPARLIPVCTGNIQQQPAIRGSNPVYPCVYREHIVSFTNKSEKSGLSLCVQGTSNQQISRIVHQRFIPVCTGNIHVSPCTVV